MKNSVRQKAQNNANTKMNSGSRLIDIERFPEYIKPDFLSKMYEYYMDNLKLMDMNYFRWISPSEIPKTKVKQWDIIGDKFLKNTINDKISLAKSIMEHGSFWDIRINENDDGTIDIREGGHRAESIRMAYEQGIWSADKKIFTIVTGVNEGKSFNKAIIPSFDIVSEVFISKFIAPYYRLIKNNKYEEYADEDKIGIHSNFSPYTGMIFWSILMRNAIFERNDKYPGKFKGSPIISEEDCYNEWNGRIKLDSTTNEELLDNVKEVYYDIYEEFVRRTPINISWVKLRDIKINKIDFETAYKSNDSYTDNMNNEELINIIVERGTQFPLIKNGKTNEIVEDIIWVKALLEARDTGRLSGDKLIPCIEVPNMSILKEYTNSDVSDVDVKIEPFKFRFFLNDRKSIFDHKFFFEIMDDYEDFDNDIFLESGKFKSEMETDSLWCVIRAFQYFSSELRDLFYTVETTNDFEFKGLNILNDEQLFNGLR